MWFVRESKDALSQEVPDCREESNQVRNSLIRFTCALESLLSESVEHGTAMIAEGDGQEGRRLELMPRELGLVKRLRSSPKPPLDFGGGPEARGGKGWEKKVGRRALGRSAPSS